MRILLSSTISLFSRRVFVMEYEQLEKTMQAFLTGVDNAPYPALVRPLSASYLSLYVGLGSLCRADEP
jgi:hypothetical protein